MTGKLVEIGIGLLYVYDYYTRDYLLQPKYLSPEHTYVSVFGPYQDGQADVFLKDSRVKIIYQAKKAVNKRDGHGFLPRNTLVVWEYVPQEAQ